MGKRGFNSQWNSWETAILKAEPTEGKDSKEVKNFNDITAMVEKKLWNPYVDSTVSPEIKSKYDLWVSSNFKEGFPDHPQPDGYVKDTDIPLYFCPQFTEGTKLINGQVLLWLFSEEIELMYHAYKTSIKHNELWDNIVYDNGFTAGYKYTQIKTLDQYRYAILEGLRVGPTVDYDNDIDDYSEVKQSVNALAHTPLVVPWDSDIPGDNSNIRNSCVRLYNGIWVEDYIKRTMWDQCTEHSLVLFSNALHDRAKKHINIRNGTMSSGHSPHLCRRDYLTSPLNLTQAIASIKGIPSNNTHNTIPPIFNHIIRFNLKTNKIVPFTDDYCVVLEEERMIEVKGMWLKFTESQWIALSKALMLAQLLQV